MKEAEAWKSLCNNPDDWFEIILAAGNWNSGIGGIKPIAVPWAWRAWLPPRGCWIEFGRKIKEETNPPAVVAYFSEQNTDHCNRQHDEKGLFYDNLLMSVQMDCWKYLS